MTHNTNKKRVLLWLIGLISLLVCIGGISFAIFNYIRTGNYNIIEVGRVYFDSDQTSINLSGFVPINSENVLTDTRNVGTATIRITGDTEYDNGIEYLVKLIDVHNTVVSGSTEKRIPISIVVSYEETMEKTIGIIDNVHDNKFPVIQGAKYGVNSGKNFSMYDGIIKGGTSALFGTGTINNYEIGATEHIETVDGYQVLYYTLASN